LRHRIPYFYGIHFLAIGIFALGAKFIWQCVYHTFSDAPASIALFLGLDHHPASSGHILDLPD
tara:strand:- start:79 stop:267 length:189 start_codon:yes stop_codon:yes gene_type:complete